MKYVQSLKLKKYRQKYNLFVAEGQKAVDTIIRHNKLKIIRVFTMGSLTERYVSLLPDAAIDEVDVPDLKQLSILKTPPKVLALIEIPLNDPESMLPGNVIYLDDIQDPGNMGTIIRIADWYGVPHVIRSSGSVDFYNPKVVQATMGSIGQVMPLTVDTSEFSRIFRNYCIIGTEIHPRERTTLPDQPFCMVIGNEGHGTSYSIRQHIQHNIHIKGHPSRVADSLNAAVATGILCDRLLGSGL